MNSKNANVLCTGAEGITLYAPHNYESHNNDGDVLDALLQKIHSLENERRILKLRLEAVESDYDAQVKELQTDIIAMRTDLKKEKKMCRQIEREKNTTIAELMQQNQSLTCRLNSANQNEANLREEMSTLRSEFLKHKLSMQEHVQSIESLRQEITKLREEKTHLENQLNTVIEERNNLLESLNDSYQAINLMRHEVNEHVTTINLQDAEITRLQETASILHSRLHKLSVQTGEQKSSNCEDDHAKPVNSHPHHSLMAELAEQKMTQEENHNHLPSTLEDDDDVEFEMDDDAYMAYLSSFDQDILPDSSLLSNSNDILSKPNKNTNEAFIDELRSEVTEIYQQMNQMCVELYALTEMKQESCSKVGTHTPDELAMVEMDFRLGSLRSVLTDLRGLLKDLKIEIPEQSTAMNLSKQTVASSENKNDLTEPVCPSSSNNKQDIPLANYEMECQLVRSERDALAAELLNAQQELLELKSQIENAPGNSNEVHNIHNNKRNNFVANWEEFEEKYEFEMPY
ncbi:BICD family-like cargo adapter 1 isoform 1 [Schistosoma japonicum]|uniref:BICD family-like cargo adapter 1 isoform 1 n=1 Tax=Schistosoma japonicum TaxID=6182 RepID=A0A4Z2DV73_SCHJA|nr:BICD family-like cargo adapter 1 isoform 1 [Schistosoma japonicum]